MSGDHVFRLQLYARFHGDEEQRNGIIALRAISEHPKKKKKEEGEKEQKIQEEEEEIKKRWSRRVSRMRQWNGYETSKEDIGWQISLDLKVFPICTIETQRVKVGTEFR